jgi:hypothetical protein
MLGDRQQVHARQGLDGRRFVGNDKHRDTAGNNERLGLTFTRGEQAPAWR